MIQFRLFGIPITIEPWFWLTLVMLGASRGSGTPDGMMLVAIFVLAGTISILVHELGHALTARAFGARDTSITLQAFGGYASYGGAYMTRPKSFLITAAGPAIQILLGIIAYVVVKRVNLPTDYSKDLFEELAFISFFWAILNLIPVLPLDGGRLMHSILGPQRIRATFVIGMVVAGLFAALSVLAQQYFIALFFGYFAYSNYQAYQSPTSSGPE